MIVKVHRTPDGRRLIAVCDNNLLGKKFEENDLQLDLTSNFLNALIELGIDTNGDNMELSLTVISPVRRPS